jgi:hypothetical protein
MFPGINNTWQFWSGFLLLLAALFLTFRLYRSRTASLPAGRKALLILRLAVLAGLFWLLLQPVFTRQGITEQPPLVCVLWDNSESMTLADGPVTRGEKAREIISRWNLLPDWERSNIQVKLTTLTGQDFSSLDRTSGRDFYQAAVTDLSAGLRQCLNQYGPRNLKAMVLVSDGDFNQGLPPALTYQFPDIPVYTLAVGDTLTRPDVEIREARSAEHIFANTETGIETEISAQGFAGAVAGIKLLDQKRQLLASQKIKLAGGGLSQKADLRWTPREPGDYSLTVAVDTLPGEANRYNNVKKIFVKVVKDKFKIWVVPAAPSLTLRNFALSLEGQSNLIVRTVPLPVFAADTSLVRLATDPPAALFAFSWQENDVSPRMKEALEQYLRPGGVVVFWESTFPVNSKIAPLVPSGPVFTPELVNPHFIPPAAFSAAPFLQPLTGITDLLPAPEVLYDWQQLPAPWQTVIYLGNEQYRLPLIVRQTWNRGTVVASNGFGWQNWLFNESAGISGKTREFIRQFAYYLCLPAEQKRFVLELGNTTLFRGEPLRARAQCFNEMGQPLSSARIIAALSGPRKFQEKFMFAWEDPRFNLEIPGLLPGKYWLRATASPGAGEFHDSAEITVLDVSRELISTRPQPRVLEDLARQSGGLPLTDSTVDVLRQLKNGQVQKTFSVRKIILWSSPLILVVLLLLLVAEWIARRKFKWE